MTLQDIYTLAQTQPERELNRFLLQAYKDETISTETFLEYLSITQGDIVDTMAQVL